MLKWFLLSAILSLSSSREIPKTVGGNVAVLIAGGGAGVGSQIVTADGVCRPFPSAPFSHQNGWVAGVTTINNKDQLVLCGGKDIMESNDCNIIDLGSGDWKEGACKMDLARTHASMLTTFDGKVIISGGYSSNVGWLNEISMLTELDADSCTNQVTSNCCRWESLGSINGNATYDHCSLQYDNDNLLFIGGNTWDSILGQFDIPDVQIYNMNTGSWRRGQDMPIGRQRMGCIKTEINGRSGVLVTGGFCHGNPNYEECAQLRLKNTIFYDFENDSWEELAGGDLMEPRDGLTLGMVQGKLLAYGGQDIGKPVTNVEEWSFADNRWLRTDLQLEDGVANFASTVIPETYYHC